MTNFYKSLISWILSVSLISSSFTPAWAGLSTEDILRMKQAVSRALGELEKQEGPGIPPNANCDEIWNANASALGADDEGMFKGFCVSWLDYVNSEVCKNGIDGECQYAQQPKIVVAYYKAQRNTQEKNIEIALTNQANALSDLIYFLSEDEAATCKEVYRQCDETKNHSLTCNSVYGDIIPGLIGETGLDEEPE